MLCPATCTNLHFRQFWELRRRPLSHLSLPSSAQQAPACHAPAGHLGPGPVLHHLAPSLGHAWLAHLSTTQTCSARTACARATAPGPGRAGVLIFCPLFPQVIQTPDLFYFCEDNPHVDSLCKHQSQGLAELVGQPSASGGRWQMGLNEFQRFALVVDVDGNSWSSRHVCVHACRHARVCVSCVCCVIPSTCCGCGQLQVVV